MTQRELTAADYLAMLRRRWVLIAVLVVIGPPLAYGVSLVLPSRYQSQTLVLVQQPTVPQTIVRPIDPTDIGQRLATMQQRILSRSRLEPIIRQYGLFPGEINKRSMEVLVGQLQKSIEVTPIAPMAETKAVNLPGFFVNVTLDDPQKAQQVCTAITSLFIEESISETGRDAEDTTKFLSEQLDAAKAELDQQDAALAAFKEKHSGSLPDEEQTNLNLLTGLTTQLDAATEALARAQQDKSFAESVLTQQVSAWQETQTGRDPDTLEKQLALLQTQLTSLEARYTEDYPDVIKTKNDIAVVKRKIAENDNQKAAGTPDKPQRSPVEPAQITQSRAQVHSFEQAIAEKSKEQEQIKQQIRVYQGRVQSSPVVEEQYKELTRAYQTDLETFSKLQKELSDAKQGVALQVTQQGEQFRVLDPANLPDKPSFPNRPLFAVGGLAGGLGLGLGIAFLLEMKDTSLRTERDVEFVLRLPVLAMVPEVAPLAVKPPKEQIVYADAKASPGAGAGA